MHSLRKLNAVRSLSTPQKENKLRSPGGCWDEYIRAQNGGKGREREGGERRGGRRGGRERKKREVGSDATSQTEPEIEII